MTKKASMAAPRSPTRALRAASALSPSAGEGAARSEAGEGPAPPPPRSERHRAGDWVERRLPRLGRALRAAGAARPADRHLAAAVSRLVGHRAGRIRKWPNLVLLALFALGAGRNARRRLHAERHRRPRLRRPRRAHPAAAAAERPGHGARTPSLFMVAQLTVGAAMLLSFNRSASCSASPCSG